MLFGKVVFTVLTFGFWANPGAVQYTPSTVGTIKNITVGKLDCAARLNDFTHVQFWCIKGGVVVHNELNDLTGPSTVSAFYADMKKQTFPDPVEDTATICWIFAFVENSPGTVSYQVSWAVGDKPEKMLAGQF